MSGSQRPSHRDARRFDAQETWWRTAVELYRPSPNALALRAFHRRSIESARHPVTVVCIHSSGTQKPNIFARVVSNPWPPSHAELRVSGLV